MERKSVDHFADQTGQADFYEETRDVMDTVMLKIRKSYQQCHRMGSSTTTVRLLTAALDFGDQTSQSTGQADFWKKKVCIVVKRITRWCFT